MNQTVSCTIVPNFMQIFLTNCNIDCVESSTLKEKMSLLTNRLDFSQPVVTKANISNPGVIEEALINITVTVKLNLNRFQYICVKITFAGEHEEQEANHSNNVKMIHS